MNLRVVALALIMFLCCQAAPFMVDVSAAGDSALEQLLEIFERRGAISSEEALSVREAIMKEEQDILKREEELKTKERQMQDRERILRERERTFAAEENASDKKGEVAEKQITRSTLASRQDAGVGEEEVQTPIPLAAQYNDGFCFATDDGESYSLCIGGLLQADYRYFNYDAEDPGKNRFDLRRTRMLMKGSLWRRFNYKFEYEFEGAGSRRLLDAYVDTNILTGVYIRAGQFKTPYGFEWSSKDKDMVFAERSMGSFLTPGRDLGIMAYGSMWQDTMNYGVGLFNGDGLDDATTGDEDSPEWTGRLVVSPFNHWKRPELKHLQLGGSFSYAKVDRTNVDATVKTAGLTPFFDVASSAKFNIIRDADVRTRYGAELSWTYGPLLLKSEYYQLKFKDITTSSNRFDVELVDYYVSLLWMITGENPVIMNGLLQPITPRQSLRRGGWGGLGLALRYDAFEADESVYDNLIFAGNSVAEATAYSVALNWYVDPFVKIILDYTRTDFDEPLLIARDSISGTAIYSDKEDVVTTRFQFKF